MQIPFIDLQKINARFEFAEAFARVLNSGRYLFGAEIESFEREFAAFTGVAHCVALANGFDALSLTLRAWMSLGELGLGDEVVVPANSFVASALAVTECGLRVRFADVSPVTFNVTVEALSDALTPKSRAVMPVHLYGQLADIERARSFCADRNLLLIEDAAQAHGARTAFRGAGAFGDAGGFSFYPTKNLGALGDAGCMVTNDPLLAQRVRMIGNYGSAQKYRHELFGTNSRMAELQAAVLRLKLLRLDDDNRRRREIAGRYCNGIRHPLVKVPTEPADRGSHVWHVFAITTDHRDDLVRHLASRGIQTSIHYPCAIHQQAAYRKDSGNIRMPVSERLQHQVLSLPISQVMEDAEVDYVIAALNDWQRPVRPKGKVVRANGAGSG
jgi:dTDP-4-amino-4,6-dideoxygalactose transaminase